MPRKCTSCLHPKRDEIDLKLFSNGTLRDIAGQYGLSRSSLSRHRRHLFEKLTMPQAQHLQKLSALEQEFRQVLQQAQTQDDLRTTLAALRDLTRMAQAIKHARCRDHPLGELLDQYHDAIFYALVPYPQARQAAARAIEKFSSEL